MKIHELEVMHFPVIGMEVGVSGKGYDKDDLTMLRFTNHGGACIAVRLNGESFGEIDLLEIIMKGGAELQGVIALMKLAIEVYESQLSGEEIKREATPVDDYEHFINYMGFSEESEEDVKAKMSERYCDLCRKSCCHVPAEHCGGGAQ